VATSAPTTPFAKFGDHRDRALAARAGRGDEQAFAELYDRHASGLLAFATQYVGDRAAAEDVVQQTFMSA
jgi:RNA polymerase sigma-70 factor (ECF subfamily)